MSTNDIPRLSPKEFDILQLLIARGEMYGLQMVEESEHGLKRGTIYVTLSRMQEKGYVESRQEETAPVMGLPRRLYRPTGLGTRVFNAIEMARNAMTMEFGS